MVSRAGCLVLPWRSPDPTWLSGESRRAGDHRPTSFYCCTAPTYSVQGPTLSGRRTLQLMVQGSLATQRPAPFRDEPGAVAGLDWLAGRSSCPVVYRGNKPSRAQRVM